MTLRLLRLALALAIALSLSHIPSNAADEVTQLIPTQSYYIWGQQIAGNGGGIGAFRGSTSHFISTGSVASPFGPADYWQASVYDTVGQKLVVVYRSPYVDNFSEQAIEHLAVLPIGPNGNDEIFIIRDGGSTEVYDNEFALAREGTLTDSFNDRSIDTVLLADADNDGDSEIVIVSSQRVTLIDPETLTEELVLDRTSSNGSRQFAIADVDGDSLNELVVASGQVLAIINDELVEEGTFPTGREYVGVADVNDDGTVDIITDDDASAFVITAYDFLNAVELWSTTTPTIPEEIVIQPFLSNDSIPEIVISGGINASTTVLDIDGNVLKTFEGGERDTDFIALADMSNNAELELVRTSGGGSTGPDVAQIIDIISDENTILSETDRLDGPFVGMGFLDADADSELEFALTTKSSRTTFDDGIVQLFELDTAQTRLASTGGNTFMSIDGTDDLLIQDTDQNGTEEIVVMTDVVRTSTLFALNGQLDVIREAPFGGSDFSISNAFPYLEDSGEAKIVAIQPGGFAGNVGGAFQIDSATAAVDWQLPLPNLRDGYSITVGNIDDDSNAEVAAIVAVTPEGSDTRFVLVVVDAQTREFVTLLDETFDFRAVKALEPGDPQSRLLGMAVNRNNLQKHLVEFTSQDEFADLGLICNLESIEGFRQDNSESNFMVYQIEGTEFYEVIYPCNDEVRIYNSSLERDIAKVTETFPARTQLRLNSDSLVSDQFEVMFAFGSQDRALVYKSAYGDSGFDLNDFAEDILVEADKSFERVFSVPSTDERKVQVVMAPEHGTFEADLDSGEWSYDPDDDYSGADMAIFQINTRTKQQTITYNIEVNQLPVVGDSSFTVVAGQFVSGTVTASDVDDAELSYSLIDVPSSGEFSFNTQNGTFQYTAALDFTGDVTFSFRATDARQASSLEIGVVTITVTPAPTTPPPEPPSGGGGGGGGGSVPLLVLIVLLLSAGLRRKN